jgi:predicted alpha/beta hydrolase family esterase
VLASTDDPWMPLSGAAAWAARWGSRFVNAGALGHINAESGLGAWPAGWEHLHRLVDLAHTVHPALRHDSFSHIIPGEPQ